MAQPKLIVFDLDYTLWPFWVDTHVDPPFKLESNGKVTDKYGRIVKPYPEVPEVLHNLHSEGYMLGVASRTSCTIEARELCKLFHWDKYFTYKEIYPGMKTNHFETFHRLSGIPYKEMLFFDDEHRNIVDLSQIGVTSIFVDNGVSKEVVQKGLEEFKNRHV